MPWARAHVPGADVAFEAAQRELRSGGGLIAGGVAYRFFFWLVPLGLVLAALLGFWLEVDQEGAEDAAKEFGIGAASVAQASDAVEARSESRTALLIVGVGLLAWFSLGAVRALTVAHALAWRIERPRLRKPFHAVAAFNAIFFGSALGLAALAWLHEALGVGSLVGTVALFAFQTGIALQAMWLLPRRTDRWADLVPGALLVALGLELIHGAVAFYFLPRLERSSELYGALGTAVVLLVWLYLVARLVTAAAFLNATLWERRQAAPTG